MTTKNQHGSSHIVALLLVILVGIIGYAGYNVVKRQKNTTASVNAPAIISEAVLPAKIVSKSQAQQAGKALDAEAIDTTLNSTQLDADLKSIL